MYGTPNYFIELFIPSFCECLFYDFLPVFNVLQNLTIHFCNLASYLLNCFQYVSINDHTSNILSVKLGVLQGSLLFISYTHVMIFQLVFSSIFKCTYNMSADDT